MKPHVILLISHDPTVEALACEAVLATRHGMRLRRTSAEAFQQLKEGGDDIDLAIIDLDPGVHGQALLEAVGDRLPVLVLSSLEEAYVHPLSQRHGARGCLTKPFTAEQLRGAIEHILHDSLQSS